MANELLNIKIAQELSDAIELVLNKYKKAKRDKMPPMEGIYIVRFATNDTHCITAMGNFSLVGVMTSVLETAIMQDRERKQQVRTPVA